MKNILKASLLVCSMAFMAASCDRKDDVEIGGKGGTTTLNVTAKHHGKIIPNCTIHIKYNTQDAASTYDENVTANGNTATFTSLKKGKYYLYGEGYDSAIAQQVKGGAPYTITADNTTLNYDLAVTEGD
ncbi:MAG: hypothetical protein EOP51_10675 [Sphingobacteriales bacterium]|nr:MAG: hypothetical protein EOP51_10675 [Sphingobacteriales bacterium]